jgi:hypothetical protein
VLYFTTVLLICFNIDRGFPIFIQHAVCFQAAAGGGAKTSLGELQPAAWGGGGLPTLTGIKAEPETESEAETEAETDGWDAYLTACEKYRGSTFFYQPTLRSESRVEFARTLPSREEEKTA